MSTSQLIFKNYFRCLVHTRNLLRPMKQAAVFQRFKSTVEIPAPKYTTSKAAKWKASESFTGKDTDVPWYQPHIVSLSVVIFLVYFCVLREESDLDEMLYKPLSESVPGIEKSNLRAAINNLKAQGKDYSVYEKRLKELEAQGN